MEEKTQQLLISDFEKRRQSDDFRHDLDLLLLKYKLGRQTATKIFFDNETGTPFLAVDVTPNESSEGEEIKTIIREIKPEKIYYERKRPDDWGVPSELTIPSDNPEIKIIARVYIYDQMGGIWSKFNDPSSDGYKDIPDVLTDYYGGSGHFILQNI